jgi:SAM-dependent methyltransferase
MEVFFGPSVKGYLQGKRVLDFGCYFGGTAIAWEQIYGTKQVSGFDVSPVDIEGANAYAAHVGSSADFRFGYGERAPFSSEVFDTIVAIDVFEHVRDVRECLKECHRMLVGGGHLIAVFPPYYHPYAHHLKVSKTPCVHWLFSADTLREAQNDILRERGSAFAHFQSAPDPHYRLPQLNGITVRRARRLFREGRWRVVREERYGWPRIGKGRDPAWPELSRE